MTKTLSVCGSLRSNHARGCVISRRDAQNGPERTIETPSAKIKTIYRSSSCVRIFASGLFTQPRAAANGSPALCFRCRSWLGDSVGCHLRLPEPWLSLVSLDARRFYENALFVYWSYCLAVSYSS